MTHICVGKLINIASDNGLSPGRRQAIIWTNAEILLIGPLGTNLSEILIEIQIFSFNKIRLKVSSAKCRPFCLGLNELRQTPKAARQKQLYMTPPRTTAWISDWNKQLFIIFPQMHALWCAILYFPISSIRYHYQADYQIATYFFHIYFTFITKRWYAEMVLLCRLNM